MMTTPDGPPPAVRDPLRAACRGVVPLPARLEPWMRELLADPERCAALLDEHGSPVNVHCFDPLPRHAAELTGAARDHGIDLGIHVARKANKTLGLVDAVREAGLGLDVGSERELAQALERGTDPRDIVLTAAVKPASLLRLAVRAGVLIALDNLDEAEAVLREAALQGATDGAQPVALRLAPRPGPQIPPTRFGESAGVWRERLRGREDLGSLRIEGVHFHLHGYAAPARVAALHEALELTDALRAAGHPVRFVDIGGGIPMSYLEDRADWEAFWEAVRSHLRGEGPEVTWRGDGLGLRAGADGPSGEPAVYPYHQSPVRGAWLDLLLGSALPGGERVDEALRRRGLQLRCEPGRSMLDGCGMTLARVVHRTTTSDGIPLVALAMNRTQVRSTSADLLLDPLLVRPEDAGAPSPAMSAYLVGAYCIEEELLSRRLLELPAGAAVGDIIAFPNTAGYLMHILESASHQIPLAANVLLEEGGARRDDIDGATSTSEPPCGASPS